MKDTTITKTLTIDSAYPSDKGAGRARLDPDSMKELGVEVGDIVIVEGIRKTVAKVWRLKKEDWGLNKIRIDNYTRNNAGLAVGDPLTVYKTDEEIIADEVTPSPLSDSIKYNIKEDELNIIALTNHPVVDGDILPINTSVMGMPFLEYKVTSIIPFNACIIGEETGIGILGRESFEESDAVFYEDIGGLKKELKRVREMIELPIKHPELFSTLGVEPPKGVLLYGPPGTGKTLIAKAVANECGANFYSIAGPEIMSKYYGESEQRIREIFTEAHENAPSIIFIDELDSIAPRREEVTGEVERRVVAQLLTLLDGISGRGNVIVIGATNRPDAIDPALRRPGRFDREIEIGVPSEEDRLEILQIHTRGMPIEGHVELISGKSYRGDDTWYQEKRENFLAYFASITRGFVGADLASLSREAAIVAMQRQIDLDELKSENISQDILNKLEVTKDDFIHALREITPSAMREISVDKSDVSWDDIGGCHEALQEVKESVISPIVNKSKFEDMGIRPPKGILLYGPPGTGKTLIAKAVANESGANFIAVKGPELLSKWIGESERAIRDIFKRARQVAPSVIFFDELDSLTPIRGGNNEHVVESVLNQILTEMDGIEELNDVIILAASNRPDMIDSALLRSGRFDRLIYIPEPSLEDRKQILNVHMRYLPIEGSETPILFENLDGIRELDIETVAKKYQNKSVSVKQLLSATKKYPRDGGLHGIELRNLIFKIFGKYHVVVQDSKKAEIIEKIVKDTEGFVGSDLESIVREAAMAAMRDNRNVVSLQDFNFAKSRVHSTMNQNVREYYENIQKNFKGGLPKEVQSYVEYQ